MTFIFTSTQSQEFKEVLSIPWNTEKGIRTKLSSDLNTGLRDFEFINSTAVALLCDVENKVKIYNLLTDELVNEFEVKSGSLYLEYSAESNLYYLLTDNAVLVYCEEGSLKGTIRFNRDEISSFVGLESTANNLRIHASKQISYSLIRDGKILTNKEQNDSRIEGWYFNDGTHYEYSKEIDEKITKITLTKEFEKSSYEFNLGFNSLGVYPIGVYGNLLIVKEIFYKGESKFNVYERLIIYSTSLKKVLSTTEIPRIHFTAMRNSLKVVNKKLYHLITTPNCAKIFEIDLTGFRKKTSINFQYPSDLNYEYHYNFHLKKEPNLNTKLKKGESYDIGTRSEVLARAYKYVSMRWQPTDSNFPLDDPEVINFELDISLIDEDNYSGPVPYWVQIPWSVNPNGINEGMVYKWAGWTHYNTWNHHLVNGKFVGDNSSYLSGYFEVNDNNVIGIDCSGFISRAWDLSAKHTTTNLPGLDIEVEDWTDLKAGDILNLISDDGNHVRMVVEYCGPDDIVVMESSGGRGRVVYRSLKTSDFVGYKGHHMPTINLDYDLVFTDRKIDNEDPDNGIINYISGYYDISNKGTEDYYGNIRLAVYELPASDEAKEVGTLMHESVKEGITIESDDVYIFNFSDFFDNVIPAGKYIVRAEYERIREGYTEYHNIPYEDYKVSINENIPINGNFVYGRIYDNNNSPSPNVKYVITNYIPQKKSATIIEGYSDEFGFFAEVIPKSWEEVKISFPEDEIVEFVHTVGDGELAIYPDDQNYANNEEFYYSSISDGIRIDGCADEIVYIDGDRTTIYISSLTGHGFWLYGEYHECGGFWGNGCLGSWCEDDSGLVSWLNNWKHLFAQVINVNVRWEVVADYITIIEECDKYGNVNPQGERVYEYEKDGYQCNNVPWTDEIRVSVYGLETGKYYKITLADDDFGTTYSSRVIYFKELLDDNKIIENETIAEEVKAISKFTILPEAVLDPGFVTEFIPDYISCGGGYKSLNTMASVDFCESCTDLEKLAICESIYMDDYDEFNEEEDVNFDNIVYGNNIKIYPNPTSSTFTFEYEGNLTTLINLELLNTLGQVLETREPKTSKEIFDLDRKKQGIYFIKITYSNNKTDFHKIVLE